MFLRKSRDGTAKLSSSTQPPFLLIFSDFPSSLPTPSPIFHPTDSGNVYCGTTYYRDITASLPLWLMWKMSHCTNTIRLASCPLVACTVKVNMVAIIQIVWVVPRKKTVSCQCTMCCRFITLILSPECPK